MIILSVCVSAYKQFSYIEECLESIIHQKINFPMEIIVSDDGSTDGTALIVKKYAEKYPNLIKNVSSQVNKGPFQNYLNIHCTAQGEFVAHIDGDDVLLPGKLQAQVDYLRDNPECNVVWHRMMFFNSKKSLIHPENNPLFVNKKIYGEELALLGPFGPHSSTMYRKINFKRELFTEKCDDWLMSLFYLTDGYGIMLENVYGKYRLTEGSMSGGAKANAANRILSTQSQLMGARFNKKYSKFIATRALANLVLDFTKRRKYYKLSLDVILTLKTLPLLTSSYKMYKFYLWTKLPSVFK